MVSGVFSLWAVVVLLIKHPHQQRDGGFCLEKGKFCAPGVFYFMSNGTAGAYRLKHHTPAGSSSSHSWVMRGVKIPVWGAEMPPYCWLVCPSVRPVRASKCRNAATSWLVADLAIRGAVWMEIFQIRGQVVLPGLRATWAHLAAGSALSAQRQALRPRGVCFPILRSQQTRSCHLNKQLNQSLIQVDKRGPFDTCTPELTGK